jgi:methionyl aminopeptidase
VSSVEFAPAGLIAAGTHRDVLWPDGWTSVTTDGKRSAQFEHTMVVTEAGCEVLTARLPTSPPLWWEKEAAGAAAAAPPAT